MENKYADHLNKLVEITESIVKKGSWKVKDHMTGFTLTG